MEVEASAGNMIPPKYDMESCPLQLESSNPQAHHPLSLMPHRQKIQHLLAHPVDLIDKCGPHVLANSAHGVAKARRRTEKNRLLRKAMGKAAVTRGCDARRPRSEHHYFGICQSCSKTCPNHEAARYSPEEPACPSGGDKADPVSLRWMSYR